MTGNAGQYSIPGLTPGKYEVTISKRVFQTFKSVVRGDRRRNHDGGRRNRRSARDLRWLRSRSFEAPGTEANTETQEMSQLINTQQMAQLPSLTRNPYDFVAISGNVSNGDTTSNGATMSSGGGGQELGNRGVGFSINGQRESGTEILLDGVENICHF